MTDRVHEGGCLCGAVRYRVSADATATSRCHCRSCRLAAGAPSIAWAVFPAAAFAFTTGTPARYASSPGVERAFCARCGSALTWQRTDSPATIDVTTATLDTPDAFPPRLEIWLDHRIAWEPLDSALPHYPGSSRTTQPLG